MTIFKERKNNNYMKKFKSLLCMILAVAMVIIATPVVPVYAATVVATGTLDNGNITWTFDSDGVLSLTGTGTINIPNRVANGVTKTYALNYGDVDIEQPSVVLNGSSAAVGDNLSNRFSLLESGSILDTVSLASSDSYDFPGESVSYPATTLMDYIPWAAYASSINTITMDSTVTLSGNFSFYFNGNSTVMAPESVGESIYTNLENVFLLGDTSGITRASGMFARCPKLRNVYVSATGFNTSSLVDASGMYYGDTQLVNNDDTVNGVAYKSAINAMSDMSKVTDLRYFMFGCSSVSKPKFGNWVTSALKDLSYAFMGANNLGLTLNGDGSDSDIASWDVSNVYSAIGAFAGSDVDVTSQNPVSNLWNSTNSNVISGDIDFSKWSLAALRISSYMLAQNANITSVKMSSAPVLENASGMFAFDNAISSVDFTSFSTPALKDTTCMFFEAGAENAIALMTSWDLSALKKAALMFYNTGFQKIDLAGTNPSALEDARYMFYKNTYLSTFGTDALSSWTLPLVSNAKYMFADDARLAALNTTNWGMGSVEDMSYFAEGCETLTTLDTSKWNIQPSLSNIDFAFYGVSKVSEIDISNWETSGIKYGRFAFAEMSMLSKFMAENNSLAALTNADGMFANDYELTKVVLGTAGSLVTASGMFNNCYELSSATIRNLVGASTTDISYLMENCKKLSTLDISGWNPSNVVYAQSSFENMTKLSALDTPVSFSLGNAKSIAEICKNDPILSNTSIQSLIDALDGTALEDTYEAFYGCSNKFSTVDVSGVDFTNTTNMTRMFAYDDALTNITVGSSFASNATSSDHIFYTSTGVNTTFTVKASELPEVLKNYDWNTDNRTFLKKVSSKINDKSGTTYTFKAKDAVAALDFNVESSFIVNDKPLQPTYSWTLGGTELIGANEKSYSTDYRTPGSYRATASLQGTLPKTETLSETFTLTSNVKDGDNSTPDTGDNSNDKPDNNNGSNNDGNNGSSNAATLEKIKATYNGKAVVIGNEFAESDVAIKGIYSDGSEKDIAVTDCKFDNRKVSKVGNNTSTVYYTYDNTTFSSDFVVPGVRKLGSVVVTYNGPSVLVGNEFDTKYVSATAYYEDDTDKKEGFSIEPTSFGSKQITKVGDNTFEAKFTDPSVENNIISSSFVVTGYSHRAESISAKYNGKAVQIGSDYDVKDLVVTVHFADGTDDKEVTNFTVDSTRVTVEGINTFTASWTDDYGTVFKSEFVVTGSNADGVGAQTNDNYNVLGLVMAVISLTALFVLAVKKRKSLTR